MGIWEKQMQKSQKRKTPSFSSSLLDTIYHSIDEPRTEDRNNLLLRRNTAPQVGEEMENLRRAIMVEKWVENALPSISGSSTDSSLFSSSSETESSFSVSRSSVFHAKPRKESKISADLKKPISPRGRIARFLNSIFSPRNLKKNQVLEELNSVRKSRSMKDVKSCLNKTYSSPIGNNNNNYDNIISKSKRSVKFCPSVSYIVDREKSSVPHPPAVGSQFIRKNIDSFRLFEVKNPRKNELRKFWEIESDVDDKSCASSDLFELESIRRLGSGDYEEELPVYGTTNLKHLIM